jgi:hypothetical protein
MGSKGNTQHDAKEEKKKLFDTVFSMWSTSNRWCKNLFTEPLPTNTRLFVTPLFQLSALNSHCIPKVLDAVFSRGSRSY